MEIETIFNRLLIFDFSHALHRSIAQPNLWEMKNTNGDRTGGIFGSMNTLLKESSLYNYFPVAVFDGHLSNRRLQIYDNYKRAKDKQLLLECQRDLDEIEQLQLEQRAEYNRQREIVKELLKALGIPVIHLEDWEGDDLIYILSKLSKNSIIVSDDKDMLQLICDTDERCCRIKRGMRDEFWDYNKLKELGINQDEFIACKAIVGDNSDNIPSACYQVGEKTALGLYTLYKKIIESGREFPKDENKLAEYSKLYNIPKRKAYLNFDENQFLTNVLLMDLRLVENDITKELINTICDCITDREKFINYDTVCDILNDLDINTLNTNSIINNINRTKKFIYADSYDESIDVPDIFKTSIGKLF